VESRRKLLGRRAVQRVAILLDGHLRHDRQRAQAANRRNHRADFIQIAKGLEDEEIDAPIEQRLCLLAKVGLRLVLSHAAPWLDAQAERSDRARDIGCPPGRLSSQARPGSSFQCSTLPPGCSSS